MDRYGLSYKFLKTSSNEDKMAYRVTLGKVRHFFGKLVLFTLTSHFYTPPPKFQKIIGFLTFSEGIEMGYWRE